MGLFNRKPQNDTSEISSEITAFPIEYNGENLWAKALDSDCGIWFEDDGATIYFYATDASYSEIYDALWIFNKQDPDALKPGEKIFVVWNPERKLAGLFFRDKFHAIFNFRAKCGYCRSGFPADSGTDWSPEGHMWNESLVQLFYPTPKK